MSREKSFTKSFTPAFSYLRTRSRATGSLMDFREMEGHLQTIAAHDGRHMSFHDFRDPLGKGFFHAVAGAGTVEFVDGVKPVKGNEDLLLRGQVVGPGPLEGQPREDFPAPFPRPRSGRAPSARSSRGEGPGLSGCGSFDKKISGVLAETEETEPLGEFHDRAGFGLLGGAAFPICFFVPMTSQASFPQMLK